MLQRRRRSGFTLVGLVIVLLVVAVLVLGYFTWSLNAKVNEVNEKGRQLREWASKTDGPDPNATEGLTAWLIDLKKHLVEHMSQKVTGPNAAHTGAPDSHLDPPPPPPW
jgi:type II secretory pathway pseudopilin PulG